MFGSKQQTLSKQYEPTEEKPTKVSAEHMLLPKSGSRWVVGWGKGFTHCLRALFDFSNAGARAGRSAGRPGSVSDRVPTDCKAQVQLRLCRREMSLPPFFLFRTSKPSLSVLHRHSHLLCKVLVSHALL